MGIMQKVCHQLLVIPVGSITVAISLYILFCLLESFPEYQATVSAYPVGEGFVALGMFVAQLIVDMMPCCFRLCSRAFGKKAVGQVKKEN
mmetsp:Transcript_87305/g.271201  ORF Transcript_87305/g.271201 Transcript_87305/m.271201 type:complete len:90 (-) Transcript_87305:70-339(-)